MSTIKILPAERKFVKMVALVDKIIKSDLEETVDAMMAKDPRMLCRLNLDNPEVMAILNKKISTGQLHPFDLMYEPEETFSLEGVSRTQHDNSYKLTPEDAEWLESLTDRFKRKTREQAMQDRQKRLEAAKKRKLDESHDDCLALI